jgi:hypothetical protein
VFVIVAFVVVTFVVVIVYRLSRFRLGVVFEGACRTQRFAFQARARRRLKIATGGGFAGLSRSSQAVLRQTPFQPPLCADARCVISTLWPGRYLVQW